MADLALFAIPTVARRLGISTTSARRLIRKGILPSVRVGGAVRVDPAQLEEWIRAGGAGGWKRRESSPEASR